MKLPNRNQTVPNRFPTGNLFLSPSRIVSSSPPFSSLSLSLSLSLSSFFLFLSSFQQKKGVNMASTFLSPKLFRGQISWLSSQTLHISKRAFSLQKTFPNVLATAAQEHLILRPGNVGITRTSPLLPFIGGILHWERGGFPHMVIQGRNFVTAKAKSSTPLADHLSANDGDGQKTTKLESPVDTRKEKGEGDPQQATMVPSFGTPLPTQKKRGLSFSFFLSPKSLPPPDL